MFLGRCHFLNLLLIKFVLFLIHFLKNFLEFFFDIKIRIRNLSVLLFKLLNRSRFEICTHIILRSLNNLLTTWLGFNFKRFKSVLIFWNNLGRCWCLNSICWISLRLLGFDYRWLGHWIILPLSIFILGLLLWLLCLWRTDMRYFSLRLIRFNDIYFLMRRSEFLLRFSIDIWNLIDADTWIILPNSFVLFLSNNFWLNFILNLTALW